MDSCSKEDMDGIEEDLIKDTDGCGEWRTQGG
jgi:hypothetical protein